MSAKTNMRGFKPCIISTTTILNVASNMKYKMNYQNVIRASHLHTPPFNLVVKCNDFYQKQNKSQKMIHLRTGKFMHRLLRTNHHLHLTISEGVDRPYIQQPSTILTIARRHCSPSHFPAMYNYIYRELFENTKQQI